MLYVDFLGSRGRGWRGQLVGLRFGSQERRGGLFRPFCFWLDVEGRGQGKVGGIDVERRIERVEGHVRLVEHWQVGTGHERLPKRHVLHD